MSLQFDDSRVRSRICQIALLRAQIVIPKLTVRVYDIRKDYQILNLSSLFSRLGTRLANSSLRRAA